VENFSRGILTLCKRLNSGQDLIYLQIQGVSKWVHVILYVSSTVSKVAINDIEMVAVAEANGAENL
jgi:hypothetical protein